MREDKTVEIQINVPAWDRNACPIDLGLATPWEKYEIQSTWLEAVKCANNMAEMGAHFSERLQTTEGRWGPYGYVGELNMGGDWQPAFASNKFVIAATKLKHLVEGMKHRIAHEERLEAERQDHPMQVVEVDL